MIIYYSKFHCLSRKQSSVNDKELNVLDGFLNAAGLRQETPWANRHPFIT